MIQMMLNLSGNSVAPHTNPMHGAVLVRKMMGLAIVGTFAILNLVDATIGMRVSSEEEVQGLDLSQHGEEGYYWETSA